MNVLLLARLCLLTLSVTTTDGGPEAIKVEQDSDVILPCSLSSKQNIVAAVFDWKKVAQKDQRPKEVFFYNAGVHYNNGKDGQSEQFRGRVSHFEDQLKHGNASIIIRNTKMADSGNYTCDFPLLQPRQTFYIELVVGATPEPNVKTLKETKDGSLLQCEAHGNPQPEVEWRDSEGNKLPAEEAAFSERGGSYYVKLNITVTKTDRYRCVATQRTFNHQTHAETSVYISGAASKPSVTILDETEGGMLLQCEVQGASPDLRVEWKDSDGNKLHAHEPTFSERGGSYDIILNITVTQTGRYRCVTTDQTNKHTQAEIYVPVNGPRSEQKSGFNMTSLIIGITVGVVISLTSVVSVLLYRKYKNEKGSSGEQSDPEASSLKPSAESLSPSSYVTS